MKDRTFSHCLCSSFQKKKKERKKSSTHAKEKQHWVKKLRA
jgi:hypothetical protein